MSNKRTVVIGASDNPERYAYKAIMSLTNKGYIVYAEGQRMGMINDAIRISAERKPYEDIDTVTLYVGAKNQPNWYEYILSLKPKRIIFNPGTENEELMKLAHDNHIETIEACTLVMLSLDNY
jgi:predicted CoA-binding protein